MALGGSFSVFGLFALLGNFKISVKKGHVATTLLNRVDGLVEQLLGDSKDGATYKR